MVLPSEQAWRQYRVAGRAVSMEWEPAALLPYRLAGAADRAGPSRAPGTASELAIREVEGLVGGVLHRVTTIHYANGTWLDVQGVVSLWIDADDLAVGVTPNPAAMDDSLLEETVLGPGLVLALTLHGTFCLHASAVAFHGQAAVFLGESGAGKSTLARALADLPGGQWSRLVDDVLPLRLDDAGGAVALPEFPQLKLEPVEQYVAHDGRPERVPLAAIYVLAESPTGVSGADLAPRNAVAALTAHALSTRLFTPDLTAQHLAFCAGLVEAVPVRTLAYPRRMAVLPEVAEWLANDLARARHLGA